MAEYGRLLKCIICRVSSSYGVLRNEGQWGVLVLAKRS